MKRLACALLIACGLLAGCGGSDTTATFPAPDYSYLPKLRLNVAGLSIIDHAMGAGASGDLAATAPTPPDQALRQMAQDRLVADGHSGSGVFTIDQASISGGDGGVLDGRLAVHLDILTAGGGHAGYAEAHVTRRFTPGSSSVSDDGTRAELYELTRQMMQDMNVEFEYQVRRTLGDWLVDASGAPIPGSVGQQNLPPPGATAGPPPALPPGASPVGATPLGATPLAPTPLPLAPPVASDDGRGAPAPSRSPPPGFLQPPPGGAPSGGY